MKNFIRPLIFILVICVLSGTIVTVMAEPFDCNQHRHDYVVIQTIQPTHTTNGRIISECRICGNISIKILYATGCNWGEWIIVRQPTCITPGLRRRTCNVGATHNQYQEIPATGHQYVERIIEPTCTQPGRRIFTCSICGESRTEEFGEPTGHYYIATVVVEPSCTQAGIMKYTCDHCGDYYTQALPALEHDYGEWVIYIPAREGSEGRRYRECSICGDRIWETIAALPSTSNEPTEPTEPYEPLPIMPERLFGWEEVIITLANIIVWIACFFLLFWEFVFVSWKRRKTKELIEANQFEEKGEDGYEYI